MLKGGQNLTLVLEPGEDEAGVVAGANDLQGHFFAVLIISAEGEIDLTHAADADLLDDFVGANPTINPGILFGGQDGGRGFGECGGIQECGTGSLFMVEQDFD